MSLQSTLPGVERRARSRSEITMAEFIDQCKARGEKAVPAEDPIYAYTERAGIPEEFLELAWLEFRERHLENALKRYRDWRAAFRNSVRDNWFRLWRYADGECVLTVSGEQAARVHGKAASAPRTTLHRNDRSAAAAAIWGRPSKQEALEARNSGIAKAWADRTTINAAENAKAKQMLFGSASRSQSRDSSVDQIEDREGFNEDGLP